MKYMGHKGKLLPILGQIIKNESINSNRIADAFCGSGVVSWYLAEQTNKKIISGDLQKYATTRAASVVERTSAIDAAAVLKDWFSAADPLLQQMLQHTPTELVSPLRTSLEAAEVKESVASMRNFASTLLDFDGIRLPITRAYAGHYFSLRQSFELDALRQTLPKNKKIKVACLAALIESASRASASPGHTAQPFQPTITAAKYITESWMRDVRNLASTSLSSIAERYARSQGTTVVGDYQKCLSILEEGDTVFADPPYSDVHYSRFYHVLEMLCVGMDSVVTGIGRYPQISTRPSSSFSKKGEAHGAAKSLVELCGKGKFNLILTFPAEKSSNGLSASDFVNFGRSLFSSIETVDIDSRFSTLGGTKNTRGGRRYSTESIVCFRP